jgi:hypothetical protein
MGAFRSSRRGDGDPNESLSRALSFAETAVARGDHRSALHAIDEATHSMAGSPRRRVRATTVIAAGAIAAMLMGGGALAARSQHPASDPARIEAIHVADRMLVAANKVTDAQALRELVTGVQDTIAQLAPGVKHDRKAAAELTDLVRRQEQLLANRAGVPADLVARAHELAQTVASATSSPPPSAPSPSAPSPAAPAVP